MLAEELGLADPEAGGDATELTQRCLAVRLMRIEGTVEMIQASLLEAAEHGETRHEHLLEHLDALRVDVGHNNRLLKELHKRGCFQLSRNCLLVTAALLLALWLYMVDYITNT